jgi:hypothetical protein
MSIGSSSKGWGSGTMPAWTATKRIASQPAEMLSAILFSATWTPAAGHRGLERRAAAVRGLRRRRVPVQCADGAIRFQVKERRITEEALVGRWPIICRVDAMTQCGKLLGGGGETRPQPVSSRRSTPPGRCPPKPTEPRLGNLVRSLGSCGLQVHRRRQTARPLARASRSRTRPRSGRCARALRGRACVRATRGPAGRTRNTASTQVIRGAISFRSCSRFSRLPWPGCRIKPVMFPPGRASLATSPSSTGSAGPTAMTIGSCGSPGGPLAPGRSARSARPPPSRPRCGRPDPRRR